MTIGEYEIKQLEKELSEKEGTLIRILSIKRNPITKVKHITICSENTYQLMKKEGFVKEREVEK